MDVLLFANRCRQVDVNTTFLKEQYARLSQSCRALIDQNYLDTPILVIKEKKFRGA
jgi:hypothetical protein